MTDLKTCSRCGDAKSLDDFHKDKDKPQGRYPVCKLCRKPLSEASYEKNREGILAREKVRMAGKYGARSKKRRENPAYRAYLKGYLQQYYVSHPEKWAGVYWKNPDVMRRRSRAWRAKNPEKSKAGIRDWFLRHPYASSMASARRRAALAKIVDTGTATPAQLNELLVYFDHRCGYCLVDLRTLPKHLRTWDHLLAVTKGGANTADNLVPCCKSCNSRKKNRPIFLMASYISLQL